MCINWLIDNENDVIKYFLVINKNEVMKFVGKMDVIEK